MIADDRIEKLILQLLLKTKKGAVIWESISPPEDLVTATDNKVVTYFEADYKGQKIALYERRSKAYDGERDEYYWISETCFGFVKGIRSAKSLTWETSDYPSSLEALMQAVKESAANIQEILNTLLD